MHILYIVIIREIEYNKFDCLCTKFTKILPVLLCLYRLLQIFYARILFQTRKSVSQQEFPLYKFCWGIIVTRWLLYTATIEQHWIILGTFVRENPLVGWFIDVRGSRSIRGDHDRTSDINIGSWRMERGKRVSPPCDRFSYFTSFRRGQRGANENLKALSDEMPATSETTRLKAVPRDKFLICNTTSSRPLCRTATVKFNNWRMARIT